ncbi:MAG: SDR family oxidoreductase [Eubacterium sp.]|nr:SDR family oxidoreductase [Eubacterium sp.]
MSDKNVLITGASRGIGKAAASAFAAEGWHIYALARNKDGALEKMKDGLQAVYPVPVNIFSGDAADEAFIRDVFAVIEKDGGLDVLVNNAGIDYFGLLQDMSLEDWNRIFGINVTSMFLTCRAAVPQFLKKPGGSIVNVSSVWGIRGASCEAAYSATKGAVNALTSALARELGPSGIRVNAAAFGAIDTDMNARLTAEERKSLEEEIPLGRFGTPKETGAFIYDLAVNHPYLTGQIITLDGGWT